jgi:hypothetical protein
MSRILAEDFAAVIDDPELAAVADAFKVAKGDEAAVQKDVLGQVRLVRQGGGGVFADC